jgi:hypothetical protein
MLSCCQECKVAHLTPLPQSSSNSYASAAAGKLGSSVSFGALFLLRAPPALASGPPKLPTLLDCLMDAAACGSVVLWPFNSSQDAESVQAAQS